VAFVRIGTNPELRPSRLFRSIPQYLARSGATILRAYTLYRPLRVFLTLGILLILLGCVPGLRFLYLLATGQGVGHVQSLILAAILLVVGFQVVLIGLIADLMSFNHKVLEDVVYRLRKIELSNAGAARGSAASTKMVKVNAPAALNGDLRGDADDQSEFEPASQLPFQEFAALEPVGKRVPR
jgi:hypothetical protein